MHKRILTENELFLAPPDSFNDEFDCKVPIRYDLLTDKDIYDIYLNLSKEENPHFKNQEHHEFAQHWQKKGLMRDKERIEEIDKDFFKRFNQLFGVLSLTANPLNLDMWNKYANLQTGFCVGFYTIPLFKLSQYFGGGGKVIYYEKLPIIKETDSDSKKYFLQIHSKLRRYEFEDEYRLTKSNIQQRQVIIPDKIFAEIILGANIKEDSKKEIISIIKIKFPYVKLYQAKLINSKITFKTIQ